MAIDHQSGDVDAHGATIRAPVASLKAEHRAIVRDVPAAGAFRGGIGSLACRQLVPSRVAASG